MKKQDFIQLGISEDLAVKCETASLEELSNLQNSIKDLKTQNKELVLKFDSDLIKQKIDFITEISLVKANAINPITVLPLISQNFSNLDDNGKVFALDNENNPIYLDDEILKLSSDDSTKFLFNSTQQSTETPVLKGVTVGESGNDCAELPTYSNAMRLFN